MEKPESTELKYPNIRFELFGYLKGLSDEAYQKEVWLDNTPDKEHDHLDYAIDFLFDDMDLERDPKGAIGIFLYDEYEAGLITILIKRLNIMFDKYGFGLPDEDYIMAPEWQLVLFAARDAWLGLLNNTVKPAQEG